MSTFVFGSGLHREEPEVTEEYPPDDSDTCSLDDYDFHRALMLSTLGNQVVAPDSLESIPGKLPRRLKLQIGVLARHRRVTAGSLVAEILTGYLRRYLRKLREESAA